MYKYCILQKMLSTPEKLYFIILTVGSHSSFSEQWQRGLSQKELIAFMRKFIVNLTFLWWIRRFLLPIVGVGGKGWSFVVRIVKANIADVHSAFYCAWDATVCESDIFSFDTYIGRRIDKGQRSVTYTMYIWVLILPMIILIA